MLGRQASVGGAGAVGMPLTKSNEVSWLWGLLYMVEHGAEDNQRQYALRRRTGGRNRSADFAATTVATPLRHHAASPRT